MSELKAVEKQNKRPEYFIMDRVTWSVHRDENVEHTKRIEAKKKEAETKNIASDNLYSLPEKSDGDNQIVDYNHPYWHAVYARLVPVYNEEGCSHKFDLVRKILTSLPNVDIDETLDFYRENGGYCDCEVILNVYRDAPDLKLSGY